MKCEGWSQECKRNDAVRYRMNTQYANDDRNYCILCPECQKECDDFWQEQWDDLNRDIMEGLRYSSRN